MINRSKIYCSCNKENINAALVFHLTAHGHYGQENTIVTFLSTLILNKPYRGEIRGRVRLVRASRSYNIAFVFATSRAVRR